jgi:hypothetical protein
VLAVRAPAHFAGVAWIDADDRRRSLEDHPFQLCLGCYTGSVKRSCLVFASLALVLAGCGKSLESQVAGKWTVAGSQTLEMKSDKTFTMGSGLGAVAGKYHATDDKTIKLDVDTLGGKPKLEGLDAQINSVAGMFPKSELDAKKKEALAMIDKVSATFDKSKDTLTIHIGTNNLTATRDKA